MHQTSSFLGFMKSARPSPCEYRLRYLGFFDLAGSSSCLKSGSPWLHRAGHPHPTRPHSSERRMAPYGDLRTEEQPDTTPYPRSQSGSPHLPQNRTCSPSHPLGRSGPLGSLRHARKSPSSEGPRRHHQAGHPGLDIYRHFRDEHAITVASASITVRPCGTRPTRHCLDATAPAGRVQGSVPGRASGRGGRSGRRGGTGSRGGGRGPRGGGRTAVGLGDRGLQCRLDGADVRALTV